MPEVYCSTRLTLSVIVVAVCVNFVLFFIETFSQFKIFFDVSEWLLSYPP